MDISLPKSTSEQHAAAPVRLKSGLRFRFPRPKLRRLAPILGILAVFFAWEVITRMQLYPAFIIPPPLAVWDQFLEVIADGRLWLHVSVTLTEILLGLTVGVSLGIALGYLLAKSEALEAALSPIILAVQSTPVVAYAPMLIIWFGTGTTSKVFICALIVFFPMLMNTLVSIRTIPPDQREIMRLMDASRWQTFHMLEVPASLPILFSGLKISATLAVIGAVVGEFISASAGLGYWIKLARDQYDTALVVVAVFALALLARLMYGAISLMERYFLRWRRQQEV